jgi:hypothetical protein
MTLIALVISLLVAILGALGLFFPLKLLGFARHFESQTGLWTAGLFRVVFGLALFLSAPTSHAPELLRIMGAIIFAAGLITPLMGVRRTRQLLNGASARGPAFIRFLAGIALAVGLLLASVVVT